MSVYELIDYDRLLDRVGINHEQKWFCGNNPAPELTYDEIGITYDDVVPYDGNSRHGQGGLCLSNDININGLTLNSRDANGTIWLCTGVEGWWTLPPSDIADIPKPYWDGSLLTTGRYQSRMITITGCFIPPDPSWVWYNRDLLLRVSSIVRGVGLICMCGNESPDITSASVMYDPSKMAIIQMADVPLVETTKPNGFTAFSLSFKCSQPTKLSIQENTQILPIPGVDLFRAYASFSRTLAGGDANSAETSYTELLGTGLPSPNDKRTYEQVEFYDAEHPIQDEDLVFATNVDLSPLMVHNAGNYFSFPVFVFGKTTGATAESPLKVTNTATNETMKVVKDIPEGKQLVVDVGARRVALIDPGSLPQSWVWNARNYISLSSSWVTLAAGDNQFVIDPNDVISPIPPKIYWRDTWIG